MKPIEPNTGALRAMFRVAAACGRVADAWVRWKVQNAQDRRRIARGRDLTRIGTLRGVKRRFWGLEPDFMYRRSIVLRVRGGRR